MSKVGKCDVSAADIKGVRLYLATIDNIEDITGWVRSDLTGTNLAEGIGAVEQGWQTIPFPSSVKVGDAPIVVGFTFNQTKSSKCVALGGDVVPDGCSLHQCLQSR